MVRVDYHLLQGRVELAAKYMAQCPDAVMPFANTSIRLAFPMIGGQDNNNQTSFPRSGGGKALSLKANEALASSNIALVTFLNEKIKGTKSQNDYMVCAMLVTWLINIPPPTATKASQRPTAGQSRPASPISVLVCSGHEPQRDRVRVGLTRYKRWGVRRLFSRGGRYRRRYQCRLEWGGREGQC